MLLHLWSAKSNPGLEAGTRPWYVPCLSVVRESIGAAGLTVGSGSALCSHSDWTRARLNQGKPRLGQGTGWRGSGSGRLWVTAALGQGTTSGADAWHEQGGSAIGAHGSGGSGLGREQGKSRLGQGTTDRGPTVGGSAGAGRGCTRAPQWTGGGDGRKGTNRGGSARVHDNGGSGERAFGNVTKNERPPPPPPPPASFL